MAKTAVVIIVVLFNLLFSGPDPMLNLLPVLAEGPVIILFAVTEENSDFLVRPSKIWILEYDPLTAFLQSWAVFIVALQLELSTDKRETP